MDDKLLKLHEAYKKHAAAGPVYEFGDDDGGLAQCSCGALIFIHGRGVFLAWGADVLGPGLAARPDLAACAVAYIRWYRRAKIKPAIPPKDELLRFIPDGPGRDILAKTLEQAGL